ncbi:LamG-like jellyroll fold domain-containing protein [Confluentibacter lentus]|uniref:LamG-like jellyroll fold domain-containing protein n=1 Tax=Confluentibacter lentus TaxID=1699412 RepID=UPI000C28D289|nr:LamG-like jellyroll fold domain-containing protein [Confluentibacter lentus]
MKHFIILHYFRIMLLWFLIGVSNAYSQTPDFKVQHIQDDVPRIGGTNTTFTPVGSLNNAIELANSNRKTHAGPPINSGNHHGDDMAGARQLTSVNMLSYYREINSVNRDMRFNTSIWEYIGPSGGGNELIVRGRYAVSLNGTTNSVTQALTGITNANKCIPFITGIMNNATSQDADSGTAIAYLENATTLRVQKGSNGNNVTVYITLVEFTGSNWTVLHGDSGNTNSDTGSITIRNGSDGTGTATNVPSWSDAVIFSHFRADTNASGVNDAIADLWPLMNPGSNNQTVDWSFHGDHDSAGSNRHFVHVLVNTGLNVTRFQNNSDDAGETTINISSAGLSDINQAFVVGFTSTSGNGNQYGRGWRNYYLKSTTQAAHWSHRNNSMLSHEIQIVDLSALQTLIVGPEINIIGNGIDIPDGNMDISASDDTDFGGVLTSSGSVSHTFTIQNIGSMDVNLTDPSPYITITGATADFTLTASPSATISSGGSTTFTITYDPTTVGIHTATISIANNDSDENPYTFTIQGVGDYCDSEGNTSWDTSVTYVSFNTINNADNEIPKDNAYEDFTGLSTNIYKSSTHNLTVRVNTDGNYTVYTKVWIDWNRDGDFNDSEEEYDMGFATNVVDQPTSNSPMAITPPAGAVIGSTRMRVATRYWTYPLSCDAGYDGEVEDYTINIIDYLINFNGTNEYVDFADNHDLTGSFSLESWVFQESTVATGTILSKGNIDASLRTGYHLSLKNNFPNLIWYDNSNNEVVNITSPYAIPNNEWHYVSVTFDGAIVKMFIDGIEVVSVSPLSAPVNTTNDFLIGADTRNFSTSPTQMNYFDGAIQEVRIWDVALSEVQIREMMNQHIQQNSINVQGSVTKLNISGGLLWANLIGYYPLDSNTAFDSSSSGVDGIPQNITGSQIVTAPLPYETNGDSSWDTATTWLNNSDIYIPNTIGIDGVTLIDWNIIELTNNVSSGNRDITVSGLILETGTLTMSGTTNIATGTGTGHSLTITNYLELDGIIDLEGESQLLQPEGSIIDADSGGYIERDQQGTANSFNYNYWSSSVGPIAGDSGSRGIGVPSINASTSLTDFLNDGTTSSAYQQLTFSTSAFAADSNTPSTPKTISTYWLYKFYGPSDSYSSWTKINQISSLLPGEGFTMKGTSGSTLITNNQNYVFKGLPNNGDITLPLNNSSGEVDRLIGNPYPSAIDATKFILDNLSVADGGNNTNGTVINGALYFWDHFGEQNSHVLKDYVGGYATYSLIGGAVAISNDTRIDANLSTGSKIPGQYIPVNQGFFVSTNIEGFNNDNGVPIATVNGGDIVFKNSQRVFAMEEGATSLFLKQTDRRKAATRERGTETNKQITANNPIIRLMYDSPHGYHRQLVLGTSEKASNKFDIGYDAFMVDVNQEDMYWIIEGGKFVIQGVGDFDKSQELSMGLIVKKAGMVRIKVDSLENIDSKLNLYIKDEVTKEVIEFTDKPFEIYLEPGTYNDRFKLVFRPGEATSTTEASSEVDIDNTISVFYYAEISELKIINEHSVNISEVSLYNMLGQNKKIIKVNSSKDVSIPITPSSGIHIVKLKTANGVINKKIIIK